MMLRLMLAVTTVIKEVCYLLILCSIYYLYIYITLEYGGFGSVAGRIEIDIKINHEGEVNRLVW